MIIESAAMLFWACAGGAAYTYGLYPPILYALSRCFGRAPVPPPAATLDSDLPAISLLIAAHNEQAVIEDRLRNALALDYPREKLEIVVASDGSDDATAAIVRRFTSCGVRLLDFHPRRGKSATLNEAIEHLRGEIIFFSDANTLTDRSAAQKLARWFADPRVGVVSGRLVLTDPVSGRNADSVYWRYENFLKRCKNRLGGVLGANGAIYAIRRDLYQPVPSDTIVDDFVIPLAANLRSGREIIYDAEAIAFEDSPPDASCEFARRARIGAGGFQAIGMLWPLLNPARGWVAFTFLSQKVMRWLCPFFLLGMLIASAALCRQHSFYAAALVAQISSYGACALIESCRRKVRLPKTLLACSMFPSLNAALLVGFFRWLFGKQGGTWRRTMRPAEQLPMRWAA